MINVCKIGICRSKAAVFLQYRQTSNGDFVFINRYIRKAYRKSYSVCVRFHAVSPRYDRTRTIRTTVRMFLRQKRTRFSPIWFEYRVSIGTKLKLSCITHGIHVRYGRHTGFTTVARLFIIFFFYIVSYQEGGNRLRTTASVTSLLHVRDQTRLELFGHS